MKKYTFTCFVLVLCFLMPDVSLAVQQTDKCQYDIDSDDITIEGGLWVKNGSPLTGLLCGYKNGMIVFATPMIKSKTEGIVKIYYESGKLNEEIPYKNDKIEGIKKEYYESGKLKAEIPYKNDKIEGIYKHYNEDGTLSQETTCKNDLKEGTMNRYRKNGKMFATITYKNNSPVSGMCHHNNGRTSPLTNAELANWENGLPITCD
ncbi:MAG: toxin-antitoxin system YwqK family antitoxin [Desulfovibrionaceae bacterium]|nr:toxin-antitoxin system YwqK family antitoxin [Desulfovibrionaceae bacterium]